MKMTERISGFLNDNRIWEVLIKAAIPLVFIIGTSEIAHEVRLGRLETRHEITDKDDTIKVLDQKVQVLLDRTARIETKIEKL